MFLLFWANSQEADLLLLGPTCNQHCNLSLLYAYNRYFLIAVEKLLLKRKSVQVVYDHCVLFRAVTVYSLYGVILLPPLYCSIVHWDDSVPERLSLAGLPFNCESSEWVSEWKVFASVRPRESKYRFRQALAHTCSIHTQCALAKTIEWIEKCLFCECSLCLLSLYCLYVANVVGFVSAAPSNGTRPTRMRAKERPSVGNIAGVCVYGRRHLEASVHCNWREKK